MISLLESESHGHQVEDRSLSQWCTIKVCIVVSVDVQSKMWLISKSCRHMWTPSYIDCESRIVCGKNSVQLHFMISYHTAAHKTCPVLRCSILTGWITNWKWAQNFGCNCDCDRHVEQISKNLNQNFCPYVWVKMWGLVLVKELESSWARPLGMTQQLSLMYWSRELFQWA